MMRVRATQVQAWERDDLEQWFSSSFPEQVHERPREGVVAYLDARAARASELGFTRPSHLRILIGYELGCGVPWCDEPESLAEEHPSLPLLRVLHRRDLDPDQRIEAVERLLYGDFDD